MSAAETRVALVTGASSGFGAAIATALAARGWPVAVGARRLDRLDALRREIEDAGGKAFAHVLDVCDASSIETFFRAAEQAVGPADVVVSNAGIGRAGLFREVADEDLEAEVRTNLLGPMRVARRALGSMLERRHGDLVFISSLNAALPRPFQVGYTATKAGLEGMVRALQMELEGTGVRATIVRPGPAKTEMGWNWEPEVLRRLLLEWKRWGVLRHRHYLPPESIAAAVVTAVTAPKGTHLDLIQVNPEAPVDPEPGGQT